VGRQRLFFQIVAQPIRLGDGLTGLLPLLTQFAGFGFGGPRPFVPALAAGFEIANPNLRRLEAMLIVADRGTGFTLSGSGDVLEPEEDEFGSATAIGSGGNYALAAARALMPMPLEADEIVRRSMRIAGEICVYTNFNLIVESL